jgi:hypothetical protein
VTECGAKGRGRDAGDPGPCVSDSGLVCGALVRPTCGAIVARGVVGLAFGLGGPKSQETTQTVAFVFSFSFFFSISNFKYSSQIQISILNCRCPISNIILMGI